MERTILGFTAGGLELRCGAVASFEQSEITSGSAPWLESSMCRGNKTFEFCGNFGRLGSERRMLSGKHEVVRRRRGRRAAGNSYCALASAFPFITKTEKTLALPIDYQVQSQGSSKLSILGVGPRPRGLVLTQISKRQVWTEEPLVHGKMTRRAMHITKELRKWIVDEGDDVILLRTLERWVASMNPKRGDWLDVLKEFDNRSERELLFKLSEWSFKEEWFEANNFDFTKLIERYGKAGRIEDAERMLEEMEGQGYKIDLIALTVMLGLYGKARLLEQAVKVFERMKAEGFDLDTKAYNSLLTAYGYAGLPQEAEQLLDTMGSAGVPANVETFCHLMNGYARAEQADEAQRIFNLMCAKGVPANTKAFTTLLDAYGRGGDTVNARAVFERLRRKGLTPDDRAICLLISAYEKREMISAAVGVVVQLEAAGVRPGSDSMTTLIGWFGRLGMVEEAEELFNEMEERGLRITPKTCALVHSAYTKAGCLDKAKSFTARVKSIGVRFNKSSIINFDSMPFAPQLA